jgi:hypothetical protein
VCLVEGPPQDELDLRVDTAQLVVGPAHEGVVHGRIEPEKDLPACGHE